MDTESAVIIPCGRGNKPTTCRLCGDAGIVTSSIWDWRRGVAVATGQEPRRCQAANPVTEPPSPAAIQRAQHELAVAQDYQRKTWELLDDLNAKLNRDVRLSDHDYERFLRIQERAHEAADRVDAAKAVLNSLLAAHNETSVA